ncbi:MAG: helix-turn-helix domain-containing protein [Pseudomonadota bacterium]
MTPSTFCPAEALLDLVSGRWRIVIIWHLLGGSMRFNALQRSLGAITHRTLARTLRAMEDDGLVSRTSHGTVPPRVDYALTPRGQSLAPVLRMMEDWARHHPQSSSEESND